MTNTLNNQEMSVSVDNHGAELCSLVRNGREYLWGAAPEFWKRHAPVLFPIVGALWNGEYRVDGKTFKLGQHGIARDLDFSLREQSVTELWYELESSDETLEKYPFPFRLTVGYRLEGKSLRVIWCVENTSDREIHFQIGAHPAFYWPMIDSRLTASCDVEGMKRSLAEGNGRGWFKFDTEDGVLVSSVIREAGCVSKSETKSVKLDGGYLHLDTLSFDDDALIFENSQVHSVTLCGEDRKPYLTLSFDAPLVGLWSPPHKNAPFVCIEPWYGRTDSIGYSGCFGEREWMRHLEPRGVFEASYLITLE